MPGFYITCALFVFLVLGAVLWAGARVSILRLVRYLGREFCRCS
jgi:aerobic C4-dicarboxylate transport protein